ncbi:MAG TPA: hypothetical protein PKB08_01305 [Burkholderiaceae bacterium]|nr:hypothetical protein [Burkholderiaceae bacterium]
MPPFWVTSILRSGRKARLQGLDSDALSTVAFGAAAVAAGAVAAVPFDELAPPPQAATLAATPAIRATCTTDLPEFRLAATDMPHLRCVRYRRNDNPIAGWSLPRPRDRPRGGRWRKR